MNYRIEMIHKEFIGSEEFILVIDLKKMERRCDERDGGFCEILNIKYQINIIRVIICLRRIEYSIVGEIIIRVLWNIGNGEKDEEKFYKFVHYIIVGNV